MIANFMCELKGAIEYSDIWLYTIMDVSLRMFQTKQTFELLYYLNVNITSSTFESMITEFMP